MNKERILQLLDYDRDTGKLLWKKDRLPSDFKSMQYYNTYMSRWAGKEAGGIRDENGLKYIRIRLDYKLYYAHRLVWIIETGEEPQQVIDHIDGNGLNNHISNLRDVSMQENSKNTKLNSNNTSGTNGVMWSKITNKWNASYSYKDEEGKYRGKSLGYFENKEDAIKARKAWELENGYTPRVENE